MAGKEEDVSIDAPLISSHNDYLLDQTNVIKSRTIPWEVRFLNQGISKSISD